MADDITIKIGVDGKAVAPAMKEVEKQAEKTGKKTAQALSQPAEGSLKKLREQARMFGADLVGRLTAAFGAMALFDRAISATTDHMARLANVSRESKKAGISAEDYQRLGRMADISGVSVETLGKALEELRELQAQATQGNEKAIESLMKLGYSQQQAAKGGGSLQDVLMRVSARYRSASTDAERFAVALEFLGKKQGANAAPMLGTSPAALATAAGARVSSQALADRELAREQQKKREEESPSGVGAFFTNLFEAMDLGDRSIYYGKFAENQAGQLAMTDERARFTGLGNEAAYGLRGLQDRMSKTTDESERAALQQEMLTRFSDMAADFRFAFTGQNVAGVRMTAEQVEAELNRKLAALLPEYAAQAAAGGAAGSPAGNALEKAAPMAVSSLAAIGGGGGVYGGGINDMVNLADRTANATERTAAALESILSSPEKLAASRGSIVTSE